MELVDPERFDALVADALDDIPDELWSRVDNVIITVEDDAPEPGLLGLYEGIPVTERDDYGLGESMPDQITLFRREICDVCADEAELRHEVTVTVIHELAHHFGIDDDRLHELGWD